EKPYYRARRQRSGLRPYLYGERKRSAILARRGHMRKYIERLWHSFSESGEAAVRAASGTRLPLPVLWLLGRSGAGKSSLIRELTGLPGAVIGSGFRPCTRCTQVFDFPADDPLMRFLDTRGLDEAGYDPAEDLAQCEA